MLRPSSRIEEERRIRGRGQKFGDASVGDGEREEGFAPRSPGKQYGRIQRGFASGELECQRERAREREVWREEKGRTRGQLRARTGEGEGPPGGPEGESLVEAGTSSNDDRSQRVSEYAR